MTVAGVKRVNFGPLSLCVWGFSPNFWPPFPNAFVYCADFNCGFLFALLPDCGLVVWCLVVYVVRVCLMCVVTFASTRDVQLLLKDMVVLPLLNLKNDCNGFMTSFRHSLFSCQSCSCSGIPFHVVPVLSEMGSCARSV